ncbi:MAG: ribbon-helix-helix protein, CopG family [Thermoplasmata archaeon]
MVSKEIMESINLEEGKIRVDGKWLTEDEIRYAIKMKVSSDDYNVADFAVALKTLITEMNKSTVLKVRVPKKMAETFEELSGERGQSVESMLRNILIEYISGESESAEKLDEEALPYENIGLEKPNADLPQEGESDEGFLDVKDDEIEDKLLDMDNTVKHSETVEVEAEGILEAEELPRNATIDEEIIGPEIENDLEEELIPDIKAIDEEISELQIKDLEPEKVEIEEDLEAELMSEIESIDEEVEKKVDKNFKKVPGKKKTKKKKATMRMKKLRHKWD